MIHVLKTFATQGVVIDLNKNFWIHTGQWFTNRFGVTGSILDKKKNFQEPHDKCGRMYKIGTRLGASAIKFLAWLPHQRGVSASPAQSSTNLLYLQECKIAVDQRLC